MVAVYKQLGVQSATHRVFSYSDPAQTCLLAVRIYLPRGGPRGRILQSCGGLQCSPGALWRMRIYWGLSWVPSLFGSYHVSLSKALPARAYASIKMVRPHKQKEKLHGSWLVMGKRRLLAIVRQLLNRSITFPTRCHVWSLWSSNLGCRVAGKL